MNTPGTQGHLFAETVRDTSDRDDPAVLGGPVVGAGIGRAGARIRADESFSGGPESATGAICREARASSAAGGATALYGGDFQSWDVCRVVLGVVRV